MTNYVEGTEVAKVVQSNPLENGIKCQHLEDNPKMRTHRIVRAGKDKYFLLCDYCSGLLVESILTEIRTVRMK